MNNPSAGPHSEHFPSSVYGDLHRVMSIFTWFILVIILGIGAGIIINLTENDTFAAAMLGISIVPVLVSLYFVRHKRFEMAVIFLTVVLISLITIVATNGQGIRQISVLAYPAALVISSLVVRKRTMAFLTLYNIVCVAWLIFGEYYGIYTPVIPGRSTPGEFFIATIVLGSIAFMVRLLAEKLFQNNLRLQKELAERKLAEQALRESEERYQNFIAQSFEAIMRTEFDEPVDVTLPIETQIDLIYENAYMAECNQAMADMYHIPSPQAFIGLRLIDAHGGKDNPINRATFRKLIENGYRSTNDETVEYTADGKPIWFSNNTIGRVENGRLVRLWGTAIDITERKQVERALRESLLRQSAILDNIPDLAWLKDEESRYIAVNEPFAQACGMAPDELAGKTDLDIWPEELAQGYRKDDFEVMQTGNRKHVEERLVDSSGRENWIETIKTPIFDAEGRLFGTAGVARDISERRHTEEELRLSEERYRQLVELSPDAIAVHCEGKIVFVNPAAVTMMGATHAEELLHKPALEIVHPDYREIALARIRQSLAQDHMATPAEERFLRVDGSSVEVEVLATPIVYQGKPAMLVIARDITERKRSEAVTNLRLRLFKYAAEHSLSELLQKILDEVGKLTGSPIGFYHFVDADQKTLSLQAWSTRTLEEFCQAEGQGMHYSIDEAGVWVDCVRERKVVIHNDYASLPHRKGLPDGHAHVVREMVVPILRHNRIVAILGVGNKSQDYTDHDAEIATYLADVAWELAERKRMEEALYLSEERYRTLAQNLPDSALLLYDQDLRFIIADGPEIEATGFSREMLEGKTLHEALPADFAKLVEPNMRRALAGERFSAELPYEERFYRYSYVPLRDDAGNDVRAMILATNITHLKQTENALEESQRRLSTALRATNVGVWEWDMRTNEAYWSDENYKVMGLDPSSVESKYENWAKCVHPDDLPAAEAKVTEAINNQSDLNIEFRVVWPDGSIHWVNDIGSILVDKEGQSLGMYGIQMDMTERKRAEEERETLIKELEAKNIEAETLRESAAVVAFELDLEETSSRILDQLQRVVPYDSASVQLLTGDELEVVGGRGFPEGKDAIGMKFALNENDAAYPIIEDGLPYVLYPNVQEVSDKFKNIEHNHILSWMAIPLYTRGRLIGMFALDGFSVNKFTLAHAKFALTFANQVAVTLENSRLYSGLQSELKKQIALRDAITAITSSLNLSEVLSEICKQMAFTIDATSAFIANYDSTRSAHTIVAKFIGLTADELKQDLDLQATYYKKDGAWFFDDKAEDRFAMVHSDDEDLTQWMKEYLLLYGARSVLYIPLRIQGRLIGHTELWECRRKRDFIEEEISFCQALSQQAAVAIENASLFERLEEEKERAEITLHSIGDAVITTDVNTQVDYLNPVAENLTGWNLERAVGQPLENIFRVIEEVSRQPAINPVERCLQEGRIVGLANHSILISRDGREFAIDDSAAPIRNPNGELIGVVLVFHDVTEERRLLRKVAHDAMHDSLTGLVNRREFERRVERALISTKERNVSHILCYLDLDQFKIVNDTAGHAAGDKLLKQVAELLGGLFRQRDTWARLGGDEFGLLLENCQLDQALIISNEILAKIRSLSFVWAERSFQVGVSIGVVPITAQKESVAQVLSQADIACYFAKDHGRNRIHVYQTEDRDMAQWHSEILQAARLRDAVANDQFQLYCQPIAQLTAENFEFNQYEILLRMANGEDRLVLPSAFIPSAERYGLMPAIDRWVIQQTFLTMSKHDIHGIQITINLSGNSLNEETLLDYVLEQLHEYSIPAEQICFELTETAAIHHLSKARQFIQAFRERGGRIALDDFGSGFSSFRYLKTLPIDYIKIDGGFVSDMLSSPGDLATVEAINQIAHTLGIEVIAEHASDLEIINRLREIGVDLAQGFGIGHPLPVEVAWEARKKVF